MKLNLRKILFTAGLIAILIAISIVCFIVGRGHTVYLDNKGIEGTDYSSYQNVDVYYKGEKVVSLGKAERGAVTLTGQKLDIQFIIKKKKTSEEETLNLTFDLPYDLDGIVINIPAYVEGANQDVYMYEYIPTRVEEDDEEVPQTDEFGISMPEDE